MRRTSPPERMCAACREKKTKDELWRISLLEEGARLDPSGKGDGRGLYVCRDPRCLEVLMKKKIRLPSGALRDVRAICSSLLEEDAHG